MSLKNKLRELTIGASKKFRTKELKYEGETFVFKQLSYAARKDLINRSKDEKGELDNTKFQINSIIFTTYDEKGDLVFDHADFESLMAMPAGGFVDSFSEVALSLLGPEADEEGKAEGG